jgi:tetratricopeptide (TPR) repeat protein
MMNKVQKISNNQILVFIVSLACFFIAAVFGWEKLHFGFNFIDEGYHMTEAWRLTAGDHYFIDKFTGALNFSPFINSIFFRVYPNLTLLGFRELQYIFTMCSLVLLSVALYRIERQYWHLPLIFSIFAFTGLDPIGMISNLYYQTYPNLFITIHLSLLLLGIIQDSVIIRRALLFLSGFFLWLISFNLLHLSPVLISPFITYYLFLKIKPDTMSFDFKDMCFVLAPIIICWIIFISVFNKAYILNILSSIQLMSSTRSHSTKALVSINWEAIKHIMILMCYVTICIYSLVKYQLSYFIVILSTLTLAMICIINTSFFGLIIPYYNGWFDHPMWFSSFIISIYIIIVPYYLHKIFTVKQFNKEDVLALILILPCFIVSIFSSIFSGLGLLTVLHSSIPVIGGISVIILAHDKIKKQSYLTKLIILLILFAPFYISVSWSDWRFTFFDLTPDQESVVIDNGFGKGIKSNPVYKELYEWIYIKAVKYSSKDDFIISYNLAPMVYMITKRRPALEDSYVDVNDYPYNYYKMAVDKMKRSKREPRLAFVFEGIPALWPLSVKNKYQWFGKTFTYPSDDPISIYVRENMEPIDYFKLSNELNVKCFADKSLILETALKTDPFNLDLVYRLGALYQKKGDLDHAVGYYKRALKNNPEFVPALQNLAIVYSQKGDNVAALDVLKQIIELNPDLNDTYYNIACIYARQHKIDESLVWLKKAIGKGFKDWDLLKADHDMDNMRETPFYKETLKNHLGND